MSSGQARMGNVLPLTITKPEAESIIFDTVRAIVDPRVPVELVQGAAPTAPTTLPCVRVRVGEPEAGAFSPEAKERVPAEIVVYNAAEDPEPYTLALPSVGGVGGPYLPTHLQRHASGDIEALNLNGSVRTATLPNGTVAVVTPVRATGLVGLVPTLLIVGDGSSLAGAVASEVRRRQQVRGHELSFETGNSNVGKLAGDRMKVSTSLVVSGPKQYFSVDQLRRALEDAAASTEGKVIPRLGRVVNINYTTRGLAVTSLAGDSVPTAQIDISAEMACKLGS